MSIITPRPYYQERFSSFPEKTPYKYIPSKKLKVITKKIDEFKSVRTPLNTSDAQDAFQNYFSGIAERIVIGGIYYLYIKADLYDLNGNLFNLSSL